LTGERDEYDELARSFQRHLAAENKSPATRALYRYAVQSLGAYLRQQGMPRAVAHVRREHIEAWLTDLLEKRSAATAASYYRGGRQFFEWLRSEGEIKASPMANIHQPVIPDTPAPVLSDQQLKRILKTCEGDASFTGRRDYALLRVLMD